MLSLKTTETKASEVRPGVTYTIRFLNVIERAKRDAEIASDRLEWLRLTTEQSHLTRKLIGEQETAFVVALREEVQKIGLPEDHLVRTGLERFLSEESIREKLAALPQADLAKLEAVSQEQTSVYQRVILPSTIRASLVAVEGLSIDDQPATVEQFLVHAPDDLLAEAFDFCASASGLSEPDQKN